MTPADIRAHVAAQPLPEGWRIELHVKRVYPYRNEWDVVALCEGQPGRRWTHVYDVVGLLPAVVAWIEAHDTATYDGMEVPVR